jgi:hypothetical protein
MSYDPGAHGHFRYQLDNDFLSPELEREVTTISQLTNAFFRWEFNSCEVIVKDGEAHPIDYANASPDIALVSLHYYFPWAIESLVAWCAFCALTGRSMRINQNTSDYFELGDAELSYEDKLERYSNLARAYFHADAFEEFRATALPHLHELMVDYVESREFDDEVLVRSICLEVEPERQEEMIARSRTLVAQWAADQVV